MSFSSLSSAVTRLPSWLITSASIDEGRWSTTSSVTLYLRSSRAIVPKIVCFAVAGLRNLCASSIVIISWRGLSAGSLVFRNVSVWPIQRRWMRRVMMLATSIYESASL